MKRKIIQQGHNALTLTLPSKWAKMYEIGPKDFVNVEEQGNALIVSTEKELVESKSLTFDISNLSVRSIDRVIRALYKRGIDEIILKYKNDETKDVDFSKKVPVFDVIQNRLNQLINFEIIEQGEGFCKIHDVATSSSKEFYPLIRRIFLLLREMGKNMHDGIKNNDRILLKNVIHKHDVISKFMIFCIRIMNKEGHKTNVEGVFAYNPDNLIFYYNDLQSLHDITDLFKESAKFMLSVNTELQKETCNLLDDLLESLEIFYKLFYEFDVSRVEELSKKKVELEKTFVEMSKKRLPQQDLLFIGRMVQMGHSFAFMAESEIAIRSIEEEKG